MRRPTAAEIRAALARTGRAVAAAVRRGAGAAWRARAEALVALALLAGWALLTAAGADVVPARFVRPLWLASGGLAAWSLGGWRLLGTIASHGLYALTRPEGARRG